MDDFYIYYKPESGVSWEGTIKAVAPTQLKVMGDMDSIRVPAEIGLGFIKGTTTLNNWVVKWNSDACEMRLFDKTQLAEHLSNNSGVGSSRLFKSTPTQQEKPQVIVTWKPSENIFNVRTRGVSISHEDLIMRFFVTRPDDPNIFYHQFEVQLLETMNRRGYDVLYEVEIPEKFSVYTKYDLERYQLRIER